MAINADSNDKPVFLLGAGFSRAVSPQMPLLSDLLEPIRARMRPKHHGYDETPFIAQSLELALSYLLQEHPWLQAPDHLRNRALGIELSQSIADVVRERQEAARTALESRLHGSTDSRIGYTDIVLL